MILRLIFWLLLLTVPALADVTITNFNGAGTGIANRISHHDTNGNDIDAHSGNMLQVGTCPGASCHLYVYGEAHRCGFYWQNNQSPFCGFRVYDYADINNPVDLGYLFDASTTFWQNRCQGATGGSPSGCFQPYMVFNAANNNYVLWFNQFGNGGFPATQSEFVMVCSQPFSTPATIATNCVKQTDPSHLTHGTPPNGALYPYVDPNTGIAYGIYTNVTSREIYIQQLTANYTDATGADIDLGVTGEGLWLFSKGSDWFAGYGAALCAYCSNGADTTVLHATSPLGTYGSSVVINADSCMGQNNRGVAAITANSITTYLYSSDQWTGPATINQGWAGIYWQPLSFTGSAINAFSCNTTVTIPGFTTAGAYPTPAFPTPTPDQTSVQDGVFDDRCDVSATTWRLQTFVPSVAQLSGIATPLGQNAVFGVTGVPTNGNLEVDIVDIAANVPTTTLASATISPSSLLWATQWTTVPFSLTLTPGHTYGILLKGVGTTQGCFSNVTSQNSNVYPAGIERISSNSGSSWTTDTGFAFMFSTFPGTPPVVVGPGRMLIR